MVLRTLVAVSGLAAVGIVGACASFTSTDPEAIPDAAVVDGVAPSLDSAAPSDDAGLDIVSIDATFDDGGAPWGFSSELIVPEAPPSGALDTVAAGNGRVLAVGLAPDTTTAVLLTRIAAPNGAHVLRIELDACTTAPTSDLVVFQTASFGTDQQGVELTTSDGNLALAIGNPSDGGAAQQADAPLALCAASMTHLAYDYDFVAGSVQLMLNGGIPLAPRPVYLPPSPQLVELSLGLQANARPEMLAFHFDNFVTRWR